MVEEAPKTPVSPSAASTEAPIAPNAGELAQDAVNHPGQALEADTRATLEPAFGLDLSSVRVHTDESAAASADALNARAFTIGEHVVFGAGEFAPHSAEGQALLAHELTHVAQQQGGGGALAIGGSATVQSHPTSTSTLSPCRRQRRWRDDDQQIEAAAADSAGRRVVEVARHHHQRSLTSPTRADPARSRCAARRRASGSPV